eukprot:Hpha_TRINITY_DN9620_c0_g2::TRINITY_DN9620_c0_g2_i1::g.184362::m.184362
MSLLVFARAPGLDPVAVEVGADGTVGDLLAECRKIAGMAHVSDVSFGGCLLAPGTALADTGLSSQSVVELGANALSAAKLCVATELPTCQPGLVSKEHITLEKVEEGWTVSINMQTKPDGVGSFQGVCVSDIPVASGVAQWSVAIDSLYQEYSDNLCVGVYLTNTCNRSQIRGILQERIHDPQYPGNKPEYKLTPSDVLRFRYDASDYTLKCTSTKTDLDYTWQGVRPPVWPMVGVTYPQTRLTVRWE